MTVMRSWLLLTDSNNKAKDVAREIWSKYNGQPFKPDSNLKKGWLVRADALDDTSIMVPVVGVAKGNATNKDPIDVIAKKLAQKYKVVVSHRWDVGEHNPSDGSGNDNPPDPSDIPTPPPDALNGWG